nr:uncharacterized protein LOC114821310 [Malus domestica]
MSFSPFSRTSLSSLISLLNRERTHAPISPARGRPLIVAISSFSLSVPCCNPRKPGKELRRVPIFPDEIEAGCRHTHLRRLSREFPAKPRRVGRRASFRRPPRLSRQFPAKPRQVRRRVRGNYSGVSVFASCVTFRRRSTDLGSRHTIPASSRRIFLCLNCHFWLIYKKPFVRIVNVDFLVLWIVLDDIFNFVKNACEVHSLGMTGIVGVTWKRHVFRNLSLRKFGQDQL